MLRRNFLEALAGIPFLQFLVPKAQRQTKHQKPVRTWDTKIKLSSCPGILFTESDISYPIVEGRGFSLYDPIIRIRCVATSEQPKLKTTKQLFWASVTRAVGKHTDVSISFLLGDVFDFRAKVLSAGVWEHLDEENPTGKCKMTIHLSPLNKPPTQTWSESK